MEAFFSLSAEDRAEALRTAASVSGRPLHILEKDVWVVWTLQALFASTFGKHLVFKGGTSLSKAYGAIQRFSEDIDVTYDIRAIAADLVKDGGEDALPRSKSQRKRWTDTINERLPTWLEKEVLPTFQEQLASTKLEAQARAEGDSLFIDYSTSTDGYGYVAPRVKVEFGARSTGEPAQERQVVCDAASFLPTVSFPTANPRVMLVERTLWEKMTAIHVFCRQGQIKDRLARHWYDVAKLDAAGHVDSAFKRRDIAEKVAEHKSWFFAAKDLQGNPIDYGAAVGGELTLVPEDGVLETLEADYAKMVEDGLFLGEPEPFSWVVERCGDIQKRAAVARRQH